MANICKNLENQLKDLNMSLALNNTKDWYNDSVTAKDADEITIYNYDNGLTFKSFKLPKKKLVDFEWVMNKWNSEKTFVSFVADFKKMLANRGYKHSINCYPTSYGIGIFVAIGCRDNIKKIKTDVDSLMDKIGVEYRNEYSEAGYVFRYVISKKKENIEKIKKAA